MNGKDPPPGGGGGGRWLPITPTLSLCRTRTSSSSLALVPVVGLGLRLLVEDGVVVVGAAQLQTHFDLRSLDLSLVVDGAQQFVGLHGEPRCRPLWQCCAPPRPPGEAIFSFFKRFSQSGLPGSSSSSRMVENMMDDDDGRPSLEVAHAHELTGKMRKKHEDKREIHSK